MLRAGGPGTGAARWNFFISYTAADQAWAEWIAWEIEAAGYRVLFQEWDFVPGSHWTTRMREGIAGAERTLAVLSHAYLNSVYGQAEWQAAYRADPQGFARKLVPVRVEDCPRLDLIGEVVSFDLFGLSADDARRWLLNRIEVVASGRGKPEHAPFFPGRVQPLPSLPDVRNLQPPQEARPTVTPGFPGAAGPGPSGPYRPVAPATSPSPAGSSAALRAATPAGPDRTANVGILAWPRPVLLAVVVAMVGLVAIMVALLEPWRDNNDGNGNFPSPSSSQTTSVVPTTIESVSPTPPTTPGILRPIMEGGIQVFDVVGLSSLEFSATTMIAQPGRIRVNFSVVADSAPHNFVVPEIASAGTDILAAGESQVIEFVVGERRSYSAFCTLHPNMIATLWIE